MKAMRSFLENAPSDKKIHRINTRFFIYWDRLMKIDTALHSNKKGHRQLWYFIVDTILSMLHPGITIVGSTVKHAISNTLHKQSARKCTPTYD